MEFTKRRSFFLGSTVLLLSVAAVVLLIALKPAPPREEPADNAPVVDGITVEASSGNLFVHGSGTVVPAREVNLSAEVPGRVVSVSSEFVNGGHFAKGEIMLMIDPSDYENAVDVAEAEVTQRRLEVLLAEEESAIAREEWSRLEQRDETTSEVPKTALGSLVLKEPQMKLARAVLEGAEARLRDAQARLDRTTIRAPFTGNIRFRSAEVGQYVGPGAVVASFYGTEYAEIVVALRKEDISLLNNLYPPDPVRPNPTALVHADFGATTYDWTGYVQRTDGALDLATRTYNVVVRVDHPYRTSGRDRPPLFVGTYATVDIEGRSVAEFYAIPFEAVRDFDSVWVVNEGILRIRDVHVLQVVESTAIIDRGLTSGDVVVLTRLPVVTDGMTVRVVEGVAENSK